MNKPSQWRDSDWEKREEIKRPLEELGEYKERRAKGRGRNVESKSNVDFRSKHSCSGGQVWNTLQT